MVSVEASEHPVRFVQVMLAMVVSACSFGVSVQTSCGVLLNPTLVAFARLVEFNAKLSDFGLAKAGPTGDRTHVTTQVMGTQGYAAPEYIATGRLTAKSDVYSFGVVLLELLSGRPTLDKTKVGAEQNLVDWAIPYLVDRRKVFRIMDTKLRGRYPRKEACAAANIALRCLNTEAKLRPEMSDVLSTLQQLETSSKKGSTPTAVMSPSPHMPEN